MSKTTIFLLIVLFLFMGVLFYSLYGKTQNPVIKSPEKPTLTHIIPIDTTLSLSTNVQTVRVGQTVIVNILIHNTSNNPNLAQLEIAYDPTVFTVDSITPGNFFIKPAIVLENIDPVAGRISFALHCPSPQTSNAASDCVNHGSNTLATLTLSVNSYALQQTTSLSFQPKTVVRTFDGKDILQKTNNLQFTLTRYFYPTASSSGLLKPVINQSIPAIPTH